MYNDGMNISFRPTRRDLLSAAAGGFGAIALRGILAEKPARRVHQPKHQSRDPLAADKPHFAPAPSPSSSST